MANLVQAKSWCDSARKILSLASTVGTDRHRMGKRGDEVYKLLKQMRKDVRMTDPQHADHDAFLADYRRLGARFEDLTQEADRISKDASKTKDQRKDMVLDISKELSILKNEIRLALDPTNQKARTKIGSKQVASTAETEQRRVEYERRLAATKASLFDLSAQNTVAGGYVKANVYDADMRGLIAAAEVHGGAAEYVEAIGKLDEADQDYRAKSAAAAKDRAIAQAAARFEPVYTDKVKRVGAAITQLEGMPGTGAQVAKLRQLLTAADAVLQSTEDYKKAYGKLKGLASTLAAGIAASQGFAEAAGDAAFQRDLKAAEAALSEYRRIADLADPKNIATWRSTIDAALSTLDPNPPGQPDLAQAKLSMATVKAAIEGKLATEKTARDACAELGEENNLLVGEVREYAPLDIYNPLLVRWRAATAKFGAQFYSDAKDELTALRADLSRVVAERKPGYEAWKQAEQEFERDYLELVATARHGDNGMEQVADRARALHEMFLKAQSVTARREHNYSSATTAVAGVVAAIKGEIAPAQKRIADLEPQVALGHAAFDAATATLEAELQKLRAAKGDTSPFDADRSQAVSTWRAAYVDVRRSGDPLDQLEARLQAADQALTLALQAVTDAVADLLADDNAMAANKQAALDDRTTKVIAATLDQIERRVNYFAEDNPAGADAFRQEITRVRALPADRDAVAAAKSLRDNVETAIKDNADAVATKAARVRSKAAALHAEVAKVKKKQARFAGLFTAFDGRIDACAAMADSTLVAVLEACERDLAALEQELQALAGNAADFQAVYDKLEVLRGDTRLALPALVQCRPGSREALLAQLERVVEPAAFGTAPTDALQQLVDFDDKLIGPEIRAANHAAEQRQELARRAAALETKLQDLPNATSLRAEFSGRIATIAASGEGREDSSLAELRSIESVIDGLIADPDAALRGEQRARAAAEEAATAKPAFEGRVAEFEKTHQRKVDEAEKATPKKERNVGLRKQVDEAVKAAKKDAKRGDYASANDRLDEAVNLARQYVANPRNAKATSRKQLLKCNRAWQQAVGRWAGMINNLVSEIETKAALANPAIDVAPALEAIGPLAWAFDANAFWGAVKILTGDNGPVHEAVPVERAQKEYALRRLRIYQRLALGNPVIDRVTGSPFDTAVTTSDLLDRLSDMELNLRRA
ncbi:MAG: hypothetical protein KDC98_22625 [Planctomycetes bacterium]|nr:hypothetical protein [Planctomycetota bacterium]